MTIGIEAINAYAGRAHLDVATLFEARGLDMGRFANLMMRQKSVNLPCEDPVTNAVNAARPLLASLTPAELEKIELLIVGTESGLDFGKALSTYVHEHLGLSRRCRSFEVKHACYGGTAALQSAAALLRSSPVPDARALVIATDAASAAARGTYFEPSEGAGAVAMLIGSSPGVLCLDEGASGFHTYEVMDTLRPSVTEDVVNSDLSLLAYMSCLEHSFAAYTDLIEGADIERTFAYLVFHTPFAGMVKGAHRSLLRRRGSDVDGDFAARVAPSLRYSMRVGNLFSASLYLALCSLVDHGDFTEARRIGLFSYGSGCASEFFSGVVPAAASAGKIGTDLDDRQLLTMAEYDTITDLLGSRGFGVRDMTFDPTPYAGVYENRFDGRGYLVLDRINGFHREYRWS